jgi:hypothetical protein
MKLIPALAIATLLAAGSAMAADATAATHAPAAKAQPDHHCRDSANEKKLAGAARKSFIKKCVAETRAAK